MDKIIKLLIQLEETEQLRRQHEEDIKEKEKDNSVSWFELRKEKEQGEVLYQQYRDLEKAIDEEQRNMKKPILRAVFKTSSGQIMIVEAFLGHVQMYYADIVSI